MKKKLTEIIDLENQMISSADISRKKISEEHLLKLESQFHIDYPENLKIIAQEVGFGNVMPIMADFYDCLNSISHYETKATTNFIKALLDFGLSVEEIGDMEYDIINKTFNNDKISKLYTRINNEFECIEIGVNIFDDRYNCYIVLVLTGKNKGNICYNEWKSIDYKSIKHNFPSFNFIAPLENFIISERKDWLKINKNYT